MRNIILFVSSTLGLLTVFSSFGQTGPAGIGNSTTIEAWLNANSLGLANGAAVSSWTDLSGNTNNATLVGGFSSPVFRSNQLNGNAVIEFTGSEVLEFSSNIIDEELTIFSVNSKNIGSPTSVAATTSNHFLYESGNQAIAVYVNPVQTNTNVTKQNGTFSILTLSSDNGTSGVNVELTNNTLVSSNLRSEGISYGTSNIGARNLTGTGFGSGYTDLYQGEIAEYIVYNERLNKAKRNIVASHLAAKYDLTGIKALYPFKTTYNKDVIGIGQEVDGSHLTADNNGRLTISTASNLDNSEYLLVGHDDGGFTNSTSVPAGINERWNQLWRNRETGDVGTVTLEFDFSGTTLGTDPNDYVILVDTDGDFSNGGTYAINTNRSINLITEVATFNLVDLPNNVYFTLAEEGTGFIPTVPVAVQGPAGIGNSSSIAAWFDASSLNLSNGASVATWTDLSGNANDASVVGGFASPVYRTNQVNGNAIVEFTGSEVLELNSNILDEEVTIFSVHAKNPGSPSGVAATISNHFLFESGTSAIAVYVNPVQTNTNVTKRSGSFSVLTLSSDNGTSNVNVELTNNTTVSSNLRSEGISYTSSNIGARNLSGTGFGTGYTNLYQGDIAEYLVYKERLNTAKRNIVASYLAAKYNLTGVKPLYSFKTTYNNDVIGIGQESDGSYLESRGLDSLKINNPSALANGDYLLAGNDGGSFAASVNGGASATQRWTKVWRADVTGTPGTVDLTFYLGSNDFAVDPNDYTVLIENNDGDFTNGGTSTQETGRVYDATSKTVSFTGITLNDGDYFTIAEKSGLTATAAVATGSWETPSTWSCNCVPISTIDVTIPSPFNVTVNQLAEAKSLTIASGGALTMGGNDTLQIAESFTINGTLNSSSNGTILANGTSNQTFANNSGTNIELFNLVANNPTNLFLTGGWSLNNDLQVNSGTLDVTGADSVVLISNASKSAQILESAGTFAGDFTLQRFISTRNSNYSNIAAPTSNATVASIDDDVKISGVGGSFGNASASGGGIFYSMYEYDRTDGNSLDTITSTATALSPGVGYELYLFTSLSTFNNTTLDYVGTPNFGNVNAGNVLGGFNLVGNPYNSPILFSDVRTTNNNDITTDFYIFRSTTGGYGLPFGPSDQIPAGQGFWVNNNSGGTVSFSFAESNKVASNSSAFFRQKKSETFKLELSNDVNYFNNKLEIGFDYSAAEGLDQLDALYLPSPLPNASELYSKTIYSDKLIRNTLNHFEESHLVPLELKVGDAGTYTIATENMETLLEDYSCVYLIDKVTQKSIDLTVENSYSFEATSGISDRLNLVVSNSFEACDKVLNSESISQKIDNNLKLRESYGNWFLDYNFGEEVETVVISIYGMNGQLVSQKMELNLYENGTYKLDELNNLNGIFVIQIVGSKNVLNQTIKL